MPLPCFVGLPIVPAWQDGLFHLAPDFHLGLGHDVTLMLTMTFAVLRVAKGEEKGQPGAGDMRELVWDEELEEEGRGAGRRRRLIVYTRYFWNYIRSLLHTHACFIFKLFFVK